MAALRALARALGRRSYHVAARAPSGHHYPGEILLQPQKTSSRWLGSGKCSPFLLLQARFSSKSPRMKPQEYNVHAWTDTPYLEYVVGLEPEGSTPSTSTGGSTLAGVSTEKTRPHPGYTARLIRLRLENGSSVKAREAILDEKSYMRDYGRFWIPLMADLLGGPHHVHSLEMFTWMIEHPTVMKTARWVELERIYSMMISYAGVVGDAMLARKWFDDMEQKGMRKSSQCCNAMIIAYAKDYDMDSAMAIFSGMKQYFRECPPNAMTYYILISMFSRYAHWDGLEQMMRECRDSNFRLDSITYTTLLHAFAKMGRRDLFENVYQEMQQVCRKGDEPFKPTGETYTALVIGYSRLNALDRVQQSLSEMQEAGLQLTESIATSVVEEVAKAYSRNRTTQELDKLIQLVETAPGLSSTSAFQSYIVETYAKTGKLEETEAYFDKIIERKGEFVEPPAYETVMEAFFKQEKVQPESKACDRFMSLYNKHTQAGFKLCPSTYEALISELARTERFDSMEKVAGDMETAGTKWPATTLQVLYDAYKQSGNSTRLSVVSRRMKQLQTEEQESEAKLAAAC